MNSLIRSYKFLKFSAVHQSERIKPVSYIYLSRHLQLYFSTSSYCNDDNDGDEKKKKKPLPKSVIASRNIAELLNSSCGFSPEEAKALEARLLKNKKQQKKPVNIENARNVIEFFREVDFYDTHIRKVICEYPRLLHASVEKTLKPKFRTFEDLGLSAADIRDFMVSNTSYLLRNPTSIIELLRSLFESKEDVARVIKRIRFPPSLSCRSNLDAQISKYIDHGVSKQKLAHFVANYPTMILRKPQVIEEGIQKAYEMGLKCGDGMLMHAVRVILSMKKSTWESKFQVFRECGWEDDDIAKAFRRKPYALASSVGRIKRLLKFFMEDLKYEPSDLARCPLMLNVSLDKRILPRYSFIKDLESRGHRKRKLNFFTLIKLTEKQFHEAFLIDIKDEHPDLYKSYLKSIR